MAAREIPEATIGKALMSGLRCRCPRCGVGKLFPKYLKVVDECPNCHLGLQGHDSGDGAVVPAILLIGSLVVGLAFYVELTFMPPLWAHVVLWAPVILVLTGLILPPLKGLGIALQYRFRSTEEPPAPGGT
ncbi:MAG: DUF983 domain-containing protein [Rhodospirillales bacterium]|nr:DUF983 domain-containing protein [Rhodospirillales bacterium]